MTVSRWLLALLTILGVVTLVGFGIAIQGVRLDQQRNDQRVTEVTRIVSASPCTNLTLAECFHRLISNADNADIDTIRGR